MHLKSNFFTFTEQIYREAYGICIKGCLYFRRLPSYLKRVNEKLNLITKSRQCLKLTIRLVLLLLSSSFVEKASAITAIVLFAYTVINLRNNEISQSWISINSSVAGGNSAGIYESLKVLHGSKQNLSGLNLKSIELANIVLSGSELAGSSFSKANISNSDFSNTIIRKADFSNTNITGVKFSGSKNYLYSSPWSEDSGTNFANSFVSASEPIRFHPLGPTDMVISENFGKSLMYGADFSKAILINANFKNAILKGTKFDKAILIYPNFEGADLSFTSFKGALLAFPNFKDTELWCSTGIKSDIEFGFDAERELTTAQKEQIEGTNFMTPGIDFGCQTYHKMIKRSSSYQADKDDPVLKLINEIRTWDKQ